MSAGTMPRSRPAARTPRVEPKMAARRMEVARDQGRRRLRWLLAIVTVVVVLAGTFALTQSPALDVDHVTVTGTSAARVAAVRKAAAVPVGSAMVSVDPSAAASRVESLPWVDRATVSRSWPGTVRISVVERTGVAIVGSGADAVVVAADGRALGPAAGRKLPVVSGDPVAVGDQVPATARSVVSVLAGLPTSLRAEVAAAHVAPSGVSLTLSDDIRVRWGDSSQPSAKADALQVLLEQADRSTIDVIDVSVPRAATVTRR